MALGITLAITAIIGLIYGRNKKNKPVAIVSAIVLMMIIAIWIYFYNNPY